MKARISKNSTISAAKDQVSCDLAGEAVILNIKSGIYFGLNAVGASVWSLIQEPKTVGAVLEALVAEYDVVPDRCEADLLLLLEEMASKDLLEINAGTNEAAG